MSLHRLFKFRMGFHKAKLVCEFFTTLEKFSQGEFGVCEISQGEFWVVNFFAKPAK